MSTRLINDPDLREASRELDKDYPGAMFDESVQALKKRQLSKRKLIKNIIFHLCFYASFSLLIFFAFRDYKLSIPGSMTYGLTYFLFYSYIYLKYLRKKRHKRGV